MDNSTLYSFKDKNKLSKKDLLLLTEAYRRKHCLNDSVWVGLGTSAQYRSKYFYSKGEIKTPRIKNWYYLTSEGKEMMKKMEDTFFIPTDAKGKDELNEFLFNLR